MNREDARKAAEVMLAYAEGKEVQYWSTSSNQWEDFVTSPSFDWRHDTYRVKPEPSKPKVIPFTFEDRKLFMGKMVRDKDPELVGFGMITWCDNGNVMIADRFEESYNNLFKEYVFEDGSPCGKIIE